MIQFISGIPGSGKNVLGVSMALRYYRKRSTRKQLILVNKNLPADNQLQSLIFSNFPILLDKKKNIYSNYLSFESMNIDKKVGQWLPEGSYLVIDEVQRYYDSRDFKKFPAGLGHWLQGHRHQSIDHVLLLTQNPNRCDLKVRQLAESFLKIDVSHFFFGLFAYLKCNIYYESDNYGMFCPSKGLFSLGGQDKFAPNFDYDKKMYLFLCGRVFKSYDSKYMKFIFSRLPLKQFQTFRSKAFSQLEMVSLGLNDELK